MTINATCSFLGRKVFRSTINSFKAFDANNTNAKHENSCCGYYVGYKHQRLF